jgi:hypothetical protein
LSKNPTEKLFNYITLLEDANEQLVRILKMSTKLLEQCKPVVPDPETWQDMIDAFNHTIKAEEQMIQKKTLQ